MDQKRPELLPRAQASGSYHHREARNALSDVRGPPSSQGELQLRPSPTDLPSSTHGQRDQIETPSAYITQPFISSGPGETTATSTRQSGEPVIGHMGRLVSDDRQVAMFAGSSTGVHFIHQAEQQLQMQHMHEEALPAGAYGLHLNDIWGSTTMDVGGGLVSSLVQQLPANARFILEETIDRWTPLYPIVHKPSIIEAYEMLANGHPGNESLQEILLYQIITLLALGMLGQAGTCTSHHFHFLCQSEGYYRMSTTLLGQLFGNPCLQSLQGLVLVQIYLQLTTRYSVASHIGGVATRIAQNLGLHRHSDRFKFDPLETELRRRVWWCQYSLDT